MYKSYCRLEKPQSVLSITFKNYNDLWVYGIAIKLRPKLKVSKEIDSKDMSFASLLKTMSLLSSSEKMVTKLDHLTTTQPSNNKEEEANNRSQSLNQRQQSSQSSAEQKCECLCHRSGSTEQLLTYIDKRFSDLERNIDYKFASFESKMLSIVNLLVNKWLIIDYIFDC